MVEIISIIRRLFVLLVLISTIYCKCQIQNNTKSKYFITVNEVKLNTNILEILKSTKVKFNNEFKKQPQVIVVEFYNTDNILLMKVEDRSSLYLDREEHLILDYNFIGGTIVDGSLILIKNKKAFDVDFISIKSNKVKFDLDYNNNTDFWIGNYRVFQNNITIIDEYWSYEIFTD